MFHFADLLHGMVLLLNRHEYFYLFITRDDICLSATPEQFPVQVFKYNQVLCSLSVSFGFCYYYEYFVF